MKPTTPTEPPKKRIVRHHVDSMIEIYVLILLLIWFFAITISK